MNQIRVCTKRINTRNFILQNIIRLYTNFGLGGGNGPFGPHWVYTQRVQNEGKCDFGFFPSLDYCDSILIYKEVMRLRPSVQGDPFFGRRRRWSSEHHETDNAYCVPRASETFEYIPRQQARKRCSRRAGKCRAGP